MALAEIIAAVSGGLGVKLLDIIARRARDKSTRRERFVESLGGEAKQIRSELRADIATLKQQVKGLEDRLVAEQKARLHLQVAYERLKFAYGVLLAHLKDQNVELPHLATEGLGDDPEGDRSLR